MNTAGAAVLSAGVRPRVVERARCAEQQEHRDEEPEVADAIHDERLLARVGVGLLAEPEADEQIRCKPDAFPAHEHDGVARAQHQHQHEATNRLRYAKYRAYPGSASMYPMEKT